MGLISKTVMVRWNSFNKKHYEELGYIFNDWGEEFEVKVEELTKSSNIRVNWVCDGCKRIMNTNYAQYNSNYNKHNGKVYCKQCGFAKSKGLSKFKSFKEWCIENNRQDVLDRWDYELNNCSPNEIGYASSRNKYWFKCNKHSHHKSELKNISSFTVGHNKTMKCKQCSSMAQYILDSFPNKKLKDVWDFEKNGDLNPWEIFRGCSKKIWIKCQEKDYHESYEITCNGFSGGHRCPYCRNNSGKVHPKDSLGQYIAKDYNIEFLWNVWSVKNKKSPFEYTCNTDKKVWWKCENHKHEDYRRAICKSNRFEFRCPKCRNENKESVIEEKVRLYLETLGYTILHEHGCTIRPKNPKTGHYMPFDNEIKELKLIIEVHGSQHYRSDFIRNINKCSEDKAQELLHYQQLKDRYKRIYALQNGYEYLEIPHWTIENKSDKYKKIIDDKIKEILNKNY